MDEVRSAIDELDERIVDLVAKRFRFVEAAARIKQSRDAVRDNPRKAQIISRVQELARAQGLPADLVGQLYDQMIEGAIAFELDKFDGME